MERLWKLLRNWWFCLGMAVMNLLCMVVSLLDGSNPWFSAAGVVCWAFLAYRNSKPQTAEVVLTDEQTHRITVITRRFRRDLDAIIKEGDDESNNGKDQEEDKGESSDE